MNRLNAIALGLGLVLAVVAAAAVYVGLRVAQSQPATPAADTAPVVVAIADVPPGTVLDSANVAGLLKLDRQAAGQIPPDAVSSLSAIQGQTVLVSVRAGELLSSRVLGTAGSAGISAVIPPGMVAVLLPANDQTSLGGLVRAMDRVDVIASLPARQPDGSSQTVTQAVLRDVRVLATGPEGNQNGGTPANLTLAVSPEDAVVVQHLLGANTRLAVALHRRDDRPGSETRPVTGDDVARRLSVGSPS